MLRKLMAWSHYPPHCRLCQKPSSETIFVCWPENKPCNLDLKSIDLISFMVVIAYCYWPRFPWKLRPRFLIHYCLQLVVALTSFLLLLFIHSVLKNWVGVLVLTCLRWGFLAQSRGCLADTNILLACVYCEAGSPKGWNTPWQKRTARKNRFARCMIILTP